MAQFRKKNGDIFEISLRPYADLYAYAKYINVLKYNTGAKYPDILRVYDFFSAQPLDSFRGVLNKGLLINPIYIAGGNGMINLYRRLDFEEPNTNELDFPQIKLSIPERAEEYNIPIIGWNVISVDYKLQNSHPLTFEVVKHLDSPGLIISIDYLPFRIASEIYKNKSEDISTVFDLDRLQKLIWARVNEMPSFQEISVKNRFKINSGF